MMNAQRNSRILMISGLILLALMVLVISGQMKDQKELKAQSAELSSKITSLDNQIAQKTVDNDIQTSDTIHELTGVRPELVTTDTSEAEKYFKEAFTWTSGDSYDKMRDRYIELLGKDNSFTGTYLTENVKVELNDGDISYIDYKGVKSHMDEFYAVPVSAEADNRIRYVGFVTFYMYQDESDLVNIKALTPSEAVVEFTVSGGDGERRIVEVGAWTGFGSSFGLDE